MVFLLSFIQVIHKESKSVDLRDSELDDDGRGKW